MLMNGRKPQKVDGRHIMPSNLGRNSVNSGQYVTTIKNSSIVTSHGQTATASSVIRMPAIIDATYKFKPTGGWQRPTSMLTSITMPKCTRSMPSRFAAGARIGAMIRMIEVGSMKLPASNSNTLTSRRKPTQPRSWAVIQSANAEGIFSLLRTNENNTALVTIYSNMALVFAARSNTRGTSLILSALYTNTDMKNE